VDNSEIISLSSTEDQLVLDDSGKYKEGLIGDLVSQMESLKETREQGLNPKDYKQIDALIVALANAVKTVEMTWIKHHK